MSKIIKFQCPNCQGDMDTEEHIDSECTNNWLAQIADAEQTLAELEKFKSEVVKPFYENYQIALDELLKLKGIDHYWQDDTGIVYKLAECEGKFVRFDRIQLQRTRYPDEKKGSLSMTEAREQGFKVEGK